MRVMGVHFMMSKARLPTRTHVPKHTSGGMTLLELTCCRSDSREAAVQKRVFQCAMIRVTPSANVSIAYVRRQCNFR